MGEMFASSLGSSAPFGLQCGLELSFIKRAFVPFFLVLVDHGWWIKIGRTIAFVCPFPSCAPSQATRSR